MLIQPLFRSTVLDSFQDGRHVKMAKIILRKTLNRLTFMSKACMYKCLNSISDINLLKLGLKMAAYNIYENMTM